MSKRIEEFTQDGKNFMYIDLSEFKTSEEYRDFFYTAKAYVQKYSEQSLYTITNITDVKFDTEVKSLVVEWMEHNRPYVKGGAVIGYNGIKRIFINSIFKLSGRKNMIFAFSKEQAIEWLLKQE